MSMLHISAKNFYCWVLIQNRMSNIYQWYGHCQTFAIKSATPAMGKREIMNSIGDELDDMHNDKHLSFEQDCDREKCESMSLSDGWNQANMVSHLDAQHKELRWEDRYA